MRKRRRAGPPGIGPTGTQLWLWQGTMEASPEPGPYAHTSSCCGRWAGHGAEEWGTRDPSLRNVVCFSVTGLRTMTREW